MEKPFMHNGDCIDTLCNMAVDVFIALDPHGKAQAVSCAFKEGLV
jgi:hypothetical protein